MYFSSDFSTEGVSREVRVETPASGDNRYQLTLRHGLEVVNLSIGQTMLEELLESGGEALNRDAKRRSLEHSTKISAFVRSCIPPIPRRAEDV